MRNHNGGHPLDAEGQNNILEISRAWYFDKVSKAWYFDEAATLTPVDINSSLPSEIVVDYEADYSTNGQETERLSGQLSKAKIAIGQNPAQVLKRLRLMFELGSYFFQRPKKKRVLRAPASSSHTLLTFLFPKKTFNTIFAQIIADMREEHFDALAEGKHWKARWIVWRDTANLWLTVLVYLVSVLGKKVQGIWKLIP